MPPKNFNVSLANLMFPSASSAMISLGFDSLADKLMLTKEEKRLWVDALRIGEYTQCKDYLTDNAGGFCAVGVLADVISKKRHIELVDAVTELSFGPDPLLTDRQFARIADMNDAGYSFFTIADEIERTVTVSRQVELVAA